MFKTVRLWLEQDDATKKNWTNLMNQAHLDTKEYVDYTIGVYDDDRLIGTGSLLKNIIKCLVIDEGYQADDLSAVIITKLRDRLREDGYTNYFLYTKPQLETVFSSLGFERIENTSDVLFMEQGWPNFSDYKDYLLRENVGVEASAIVMNANPFTRGHRYLIETAAKSSKFVYVFVLSENLSVFSEEDRFEMVCRGTAHLNNVKVLHTKNYLVSLATFPSYFLSDRFPESVAVAHAELDANLFKNRIAPILDIHERFVGEEPYSVVTEVYNNTMKKVFKDSINLKVIPRLTIKENIISATKVRAAIRDNNTSTIEEFLPVTTLEYLKQIKKL